MSTCLRSPSSSRSSRCRRLRWPHWIRQHLDHRIELAIVDFEDLRQLLLRRIAQVLDVLLLYRQHVFPVRLLTVGEQVEKLHGCDEADDGEYDNGQHQRRATEATHHIPGYRSGRLDRALRQLTPLAAIRHSLRGRDLGHRHACSLLLRFQFLRDFWSGRGIVALQTVVAAAAASVALVALVAFIAWRT